MSIEEIEETIEDCRNMASEDVFDCEKGHVKKVNIERYVQLLEELLRGALTHVKRLK